MFKRLFVVAIAAGGVAAAVLTLVDAYTTVPLILHAEVYEQAETPARASPAGARATVLPAAYVGGPAAPGILPAHLSERSHGVAASSPFDHPVRMLLTLAANLVTGIGFAFLLVGCFALDRARVDPARGVAWGLAGFAVFTLAPALGLPPELPGTMSADLADRQIWWLFAAAATALGLWLVVFGGRRWTVPLGIGVAALPHILGAPQPDALGGPVPPELAGHFAAASIVTNAIFWVALGWFAGVFWKRSTAS